MKIRKAENRKRPVRSLRAKLLGVFIIYGVALLVLLWVLQLGLLDNYYESSMQHKCRISATTISNMYSNSTELSYDSFCDALGNLSADNDIYFLVRAWDGSFQISSSENAKSGRYYIESKNVIEDAMRRLSSDSDGEVFYTIPLNSEFKYIVFAKLIKSEYRKPIYLFATASLKPLGPAVSILRSQLLIISAVVLILGVIIAFITSKRLATPIINMNSEAKKLGMRDFDLKFEGADYKEINELADSLNNAALDLKTSDNLQKDLLANVSHDLKTPLTMIKSYAEMIKDISGSNKKKREEHLNVIIDESDRLALLVNDILELSKVQSGAEEFTMEVFDLQKAALDVFKTYEVVKQEGFDMQFESVPKEINVLGDESKIKQVISNLISNAVKYSEEEKYVKLYFEEIGKNKVRLYVQDKGIGIAKELQDVIWNRYQRASQRAGRSKEGSGLGLSICSEILKRHSADFGVISTPGEGSTFWFEMKKE